jgi:tetratricopeptide (TPR) repeat protein
VSTALATTPARTPVASVETTGPSLPIPWRDPHTVSPAVLAQHIQALEQACLENPQSADLRTCLGMAYAVNYDVYKSMDALEAATDIDPQHFWAQLKYAELYYRLRALPRAEAETLKALDLAENGWQLALARKQLQEIRRLTREGARRVSLNKPLLAPALVTLGMIVALFVAFAWR